MSTPVVAVTQAPTFGGLTGYKRPLASNPTRVPSNLPAFRGRTATPGGEVRAPPIQASRNRQDQGTNVAIPYSRLCPINHERGLGRVGRGDVAFMSRLHVDHSHVAGQRRERVAGIDYLNDCLGNNTASLPPGLTTHPNWKVGETVLLGGKTNFDDDAISAQLADNWREASFLRDWVCDGVVLSNDEPYAHTSNGAQDVQQFNIIVQGPTSVNNGYVDHRGRGVEAYPRALTEANGMYAREGSVAMGGTAYHPSYPLQMFDRKVKPLSTLFVGLVAERRLLTPEIRAGLLKNSNLDASSKDYQRLTEAASADPNDDVFYTFKFVCFSDRAARQNGLVASLKDAWQLAEMPGKNQRPAHIKDVPEGSLSFDPFEPASLSEYRHMVGAWKVGRVMDTAARRKDTFAGGPIDTADQLGVNVCVEWLDWRALRRTVNREDIGGYLPGAAMWLRTTEVFAGSGEYADADDKRVFAWPSAYTPRGAVPQLKPSADKAAEVLNAPLNMERDPRNDMDLKTDASTQMASYAANAKAMHDTVRNDATPLGIQKRLAQARAVDVAATPSQAEAAALFDKIAGAGSSGSSEFDLDQLLEFVSKLDISNASDFKEFQTLFGDNKFKTVADAQSISDLAAATKLLYVRMTWFTDGAPRTGVVSKDMFETFLIPAAASSSSSSSGGGGGGGGPISSLAPGAQAAADLLMNQVIELSGSGNTGMTGVTSMAEETSSAVAAVAAASVRTGKAGGKAGGKTSSKAASVPVSATAATAAATKKAATAASTIAPTAKTATTATTTAASTAPPAPDSSDIFSAIFGSSAGTGACTGVGEESDKSPSTGNPRSRVRRARDGR